ncbi:MAG TPA: alpha/beta fold hydrolase, partial [Burkholderiaceae bacterium]|nr:alpha/beta fold hydrolase [Burkholderiaceae bacterium]
SLCLLGGFEARLEPAAPLSFQTRKAQALLAYLALPAGKLHARSALATLLWGETDNERARASLRRALHELRNALGTSAHAVLRIDDETVALNASAVEVDVALFMGSFKDETPAALERAAALYRGDLLAGFDLKEEGFNFWLSAQREALRERALQALSKLVAQRRRAGELDGAMAAAMQVLALEPAQEEMHRTLMRLYLETGRRGAALRQYQHCVYVLQRELGVAPEAETKQLYQHVLRQRDTDGGTGQIAAAPPVSLSTAGFEADAERRTRATETAFVGRAAEMTRLRAALEEAAAGHGGLLAIVGEAGIGKSRVVEELVSDAARQACRVWVGRAYESDQILLFGPIVDALRSARVSRDHTLIGALGAAWRNELAQLLPELTEGAPPTALPDVHVNYKRLFDGIAHLIEAAAGRRTVVLVLEDLHWGDEMSVRLLAFLARRLQTLRVLVIVTTREEELADATLLRHTLEDLRRAGQMTWIDLGPLSQADTLALIRLLRRPGAQTSVHIDDHIWTASEGNPFVAIEIVRALEQGFAATAKALPQPVRDVISRRLDRLSAAGRSILGVAAAIGREFEFRLLWRATGCVEDLAVAGVEELIRVRVLTSVGERLDFVHERVRETAYAALGAWRRAEVHGRIAAAVEDLYANRLPDFWEMLADHYERAEAWAQAATYALRVAERARRRYALATAERACSQAAQAAARTEAAAHERSEALSLLGDILSLKGELELSNESYHAALRTADSEAARTRIANKMHRARFAIRDGARLAYYEHGSGAATLLLMNPLVYGLELFQPVLEQLCQEFRVITMDARGTGRSDPIPLTHRCVDHAADVAAVIRAAGGDPVVAIGFSKSGNYLARLAVDEPALVKKLVLLGTPIDVRPGCEFLVASEIDDQFRKALREGDLERAVPFFVATIVTDPDTGDLAEQVTRSMLRLPRETLINNWTPDPTIDIASVLPAVNVPTLVMHGTEDLRVSLQSSRYLAEHIPHARLYLFDGRGHLPIFTATAEFCDVLRRFLAANDLTCA